jgi:hypothetical protein
MPTGTPEHGRRNKKSTSTTLPTAERAPGTIRHPESCGGQSSDSYGRQESTASPRRVGDATKCLS